jgi:DNA-directed RNA polymerase specialized sigma24 family protein
MLSEGPAHAQAVRDVQRELEFLKLRIRALARGRFPDEHDDVASDAWIRLDRTLRREGARNEEALMTHIAWRAWVDFCRKKSSESRALGAPVPLDDVEVEAVSQGHGVDPEELAMWRFAVCEWFAQHQPPCLETARHYLEGRSWVEAAAVLRERPNSLAKRWQRCREQFLEMVRADRGQLREILDYFERST